jgi:hypothetical protein
MKNLLITLAVFTQSALAAVDLETSQLKYSSNLSDRFEATALALERGYPLGSVKASASQKDERITSVSQLAEVLKANVQELEAASAKAQQELAAKFEAAIAASDLNKPAEKPVVAVGNYDEAAFLNCAGRTLPILKARIQMETMGDSLNIGLVDAGLAKERGDGVAINEAGIPCGKYLGPAGLRSFSTEQDIKALSALTVRKEKADRELLLKLLTLRRVAMAEKTQLSAFWEFLWQQYSFRAVFSNKPFPDVKEQAVTYFAAAYLDDKMQPEDRSRLTAIFVEDVQKSWNQPVSL